MDVSVINNNSNKPTLVNNEWVRFVYTYTCLLYTSTIASLEPTYQLRTPDISDFAISSRYYNSSYSERVSITKAKHNDSNKDNISKTNELLNQLISLMKNNNLNNEDIIIQVNLEGEKIVDYVSKKMARNVRKRM